MKRLEGDDHTPPAGSGEDDASRSEHSNPSRRRALRRTGQPTSRQENLSVIPQSLEGAARRTTFDALSGPTPFATLDFARDGRIDAMTLCRKEPTPSDDWCDFSMAVCRQEPMRPSGQHGFTMAVCQKELRA
jgi:hypothetical protein